MRIINGNPEILRIGWQVAALPPRIPPGVPGLSAAFFVKGSWKLNADGPVGPFPDGPIPPLGDLPLGGDPAQGLGHASDYVPFKPRAEFLLTGSAVAPSGGERREFPVSVRVGVWRKSVLILGPRKWKDGLFGAVPGEPGPAGAVPLSYARAWGGVGFDLNPLGIGRDTPEMPQVEWPGERVDGRRARVAPAGFAPIPRDWPQRAAKVGSYRGRWTEERWPWLPDDFDYSYFNAAPPSQWVDQPWRGDEEVVLENLHPEKAKVVTALPGVRARCWVTRTEDRTAEGRPGPLEEVELVLDTVCVDMDRELVTLVWRGRCAVQTIKLPDIDAVFFCAEPLDAPLAASEAARRLEDGLFPPSELPDGAPPEALAPLAERIELEIQTARARLFQSLAAAWTGFGAAARTAANPPELTPERKAVLDRAAAETARVWAVAGPPPDDPTQGLPAGVREKLEFPSTDEPDPKAIEHNVAAGLAAKARERDAVLAAFDAGPRREDFFADGRLIVGKLLDGSACQADLSGVDFSGLEIPGAKFSRARLAGARFSGSRLLGADFSGADLSGVDFSGADLHLVNFGEADLHDAVFAGAVVRKIFLPGARLAGVNLDGLDLSDSLGPQADFSGASLRGARLARGLFPSADFSGACVEEADFSEAKLSFADFRSARGDRAVFAGAEMPNFRGGDAASFVQGDFRGVTAPESLWEGSSLAGADFFEAKLVRARFCEADLAGGVLARADLRDAVLEDAGLVRAVLTEANLLRAVLDRADLTDACLDGANLYDASLWESTLHRATWRKAFVKKTRLDV